MLQLHFFVEVIVQTIQYYWQTIVHVKIVMTRQEDTSFFSSLFETINDDVCAVFFVVVVVIADAVA